MDFNQFISKRFYLDGAIGTRLIEKGYSTKNAERLNVTNPQVITEISESYFAAGADAVFTNTFSLNGLNYERVEMEKLAFAAVDCAKNAAKKYGGLVGYSVGPLSAVIEPYGELSRKKAFQLYLSQAEIVAKTDVDFVAIETMTDLCMTRLAVLAFREKTKLPIFVAMSFDENGKTFFGASAESFAVTMSALGVSAIGCNCGLGADKLKAVTKKLVEFSNCPVYIKPNAGMPRAFNGKAVYDVTPSEFAESMREIACLGARGLGGCCGTDERHIRALKNLTKDIPIISVKKGFDGVCSNSVVVPFSGFTVIGERLNPTGKKALKEAIIASDFETVKQIAVEQESLGAKILDVNAGLNGIDERAAVCKMVESVQSATSCAVQIDSLNENVIEEVLFVANGVPIINSVSLDKEKMSEIFPLAAKYGAYVVCLCLDEKGIPTSAKERADIAEKLVLAAESYNVKREKLLIDPLVCAVAVDKDNADITLEAARLIKQKLNVKCVLGLSNVSFGLPKREKINGAFLAEAKRNSIDAAIVNPAIKECFDEDARAVIRGDEGALARFISQNAEAQATNEKPRANDKTITECVLYGLKGEGLKLAKQFVNKQNYQEVLERDVIGGLNELGTRYGRGQVFLPELMAGSNAASAILDYIKDNFIESGKVTGEKIILATVYGDVHDIGKNIVKAVLSNYGFQVIDLGKNVPASAVVEAVLRENAHYVGLSALMTTTLGEMEKTVKAIKAETTGVTVLLGGAVVNAEYAKSLGALYSKDAAEAALLMQSLVKQKKTEV